jgi:hypothetical protein
MREPTPAARIIAFMTAVSRPPARELIYYAQTECSIDARKFGDARISGFASPPEKPNAGRKMPDDSTRICYE